MLEDKLLLDMKPAPPKEVGEAKKVLSGGRLFRGRCKWEESEYVFEVATDRLPRRPNHLAILAALMAGARRWNSKNAA